MNKLSLSHVSLALASALAASAAMAATVFDTSTAPSGAHYRNGYSEPVCTLNGLIVSCTGTQIGGVGNNDADLVLAVSYTATVQCRNRGDQIVDVKTQVKTSTSSDSLTDVRNGTLYVSSVTASAPSNQTFLRAASCPNGNWTKELLGSPVVSSYTYTLTFEGYNMPAITITGP